MSKQVVVEGEVVTKDGRGVSIEFYERTFILSGEVRDEAQARQIIRKGMITEELRKTVENFKHVRTCQVISMSDTNEAAPASELDALLIEAARLGCIPENIDNYKRADYKAKALQKAIDAFHERASNNLHKNETLSDPE